MTADEATVTHVLELITLQQRVHEYFGTTIDTEVDPEEANQKKISYVLNSTEDTTDDAGNTVVDKFPSQLFSSQHNLPDSTVNIRTLG